jgi:hypothetical protein
VLRLLVDTSVWLDLAKRRDGQKWIVPLRVLMSQGRLELLAPSVVVEEFERNRPRAEAAVTSSVLERFRQLRQDVHEYGPAERYQWLEEMAHSVPIISSATLQNFTEIGELLKRARRLEPSNVEIEGVVRRGIEKMAPFHLQKNSTADALIIELYSSSLHEADQDDEQYCFVTSNYHDFSIPNGDRRQPHPDLAPLFADQRSGYFYGVEGLNTALESHFEHDFIVLADEAGLAHEEPRTLAEILEAEREFFDKVWYVRKLILQEKIQAGEHTPLASELADQMQSAMRAVEERYGAENVGPWNDWEWGFVNGKLSALRWVLGSDWDFLDT